MVVIEGKGRYKPEEEEPTIAPSAKADKRP